MLYVKIWRNWPSGSGKDETFFSSMADETDDRMYGKKNRLMVKKWVLLAFGSGELKRDWQMHMLTGINLLLYVQLKKSLKIHVLNDERID